MRSPTRTSASTRTAPVRHLYGCFAQRDGCPVHRQIFATSSVGADPHRADRLRVLVVFGAHAAVRPSSDRGSAPSTSPSSHHIDGAPADLGDSVQGKVIALWIMGFGGMVPFGIVEAGHGSSITPMILICSVVSLTTPGGPTSSRAARPAFSPSNPPPPDRHPTHRCELRMSARPIGRARLRSSLAQVGGVSRAAATRSRPAERLALTRTTSPSPRPRSCKRRTAASTSATASSPSTWYQG